MRWLRGWLLMAAWFAGCSTLSAQWVTQTNSLRAGWNSLFLQVDPSHATIDQLVSDVGNPIQEIWYWLPEDPSGRFVESPQLPTGAGSRWVTWARGQGTNAVLQRMAANGAYLVRLGTNAAPYDWRVKGRPVIPTYRWSLTGLNFIGFPTVPAPTASQPFWETFLAQAPELQQTAEIYRYPGGELGATNPVRLLTFRTTRMQRDQAYWVRAGETYNEYFGPVRLVQADPAGLKFGATRGQERFRLRNAAPVPVTVTVRQLASEPAPAGQPSIQAQPVLLLRGSLNPTNLTYGHTNLASGPQRWTLEPAGDPGSEVEVVIGLNRAAMSGPAGALHAAVLRFTDSLGLSQVDVAVSAERASSAGLWVGQAAVSQVGHYLKPYARATNDADLSALLSRLQLGQGLNGYRYERDPVSGRVLIFGGPDQRTGSYLLDGQVKVDAGTVARPYPLRLLVHHDGATARLLQKVYHGVGLASNTVLATRENLLLPSQLAGARRLSAVHLPTSDANVPWVMSGSMQTGGALTGVVPLAYDDQASNPFLHTYHPDHDNLDATFRNALERGRESYDVVREIGLSFAAPAGDFDSLTVGGADLSGTYVETITLRGRGSAARQFSVTGAFSLKRLSDIATLTTQ